MKRVIISCHGSFDDIAADIQNNCVPLYGTGLKHRNGAEVG